MPKIGRQIFAGAADGVQLAVGGPCQGFNELWTDEALSTPTLFDEGKQLRQDLIHDEIRNPLDEPRSTSL